MVVGPWKHRAIPHSQKPPHQLSPFSCKINRTINYGPKNHQQQGSHKTQTLFSFSLALFSAYFLHLSRELKLTASSFVQILTSFRSHRAAFRVLFSSSLPLSLSLSPALMAMEDNESCSSRAVDSSPTHPRQQRHKLEVYNEVLHRLRDSFNEEAKIPGFDDELWAHFNRLPARSLSKTLPPSSRSFDHSLHDQINFLLYEFDPVCYFVFSFSASDRDFKYFTLSCIIFLFLFLFSFFVINGLDSNLAPFEIRFDVVCV